MTATSGNTTYLEYQLKDPKPGAQSGLAEELQKTRTMGLKYSNRYYAALKTLRLFPLQSINYLLFSFSLLFNAPLVSSLRANTSRSIPWILDNLVSAQCLAHSELDSENGRKEEIYNLYYTCTYNHPKKIGMNLYLALEMWNQKHLI